jgi:GH25 family lysozyme M1 (1,4-beta-N-acetylmuramidase)
MSSVVVIDLSYWKKAHQVPYHLFKEHDILLVVIKASMGGGYDQECDTHVGACKANGLKFGLYHWCDPIQDDERQAGFFLDKIYQHQPDYLMYDVEQWWDDWAKWQNKEATYPEDSIPRGQVSSNFEAVYQKVTAESGYAYERQLIYTAEWFTDLYPALVQSIRDFPGKKWWADYSKLSLLDWRVDWEQFHFIFDEHLPPFTPNSPYRPNGLPWDCWQVQSRIILPGATSRLDTNLASEGLAQEIRNLYNGNIPTPDPEEPNIATLAYWPIGSLVHG